MMLPAATAALSPPHPPAVGTPIVNSFSSHHANSTLSTTSSAPSTPLHNNRSSTTTPVHVPPSTSSSPKPTVQELKARTKGKAKALISPKTESPLQQQPQQQQQQEGLKDEGSPRS